MDHAFDVFQNKWKIIKNHMPLWNFDRIGNIITIYIIMYNKIVENKHSLWLEPFVALGIFERIVLLPFTFNDYQTSTREIKKVETYFALHRDKILGYN